MDWRTAEAEFDDHVMGPVPLPRMFADAADRHGREVAQRYKGGTYERTLTPEVVPAVGPGEWGAVTYDEMHEIVKRLSAGFQELGVEFGDRVGIFAETRMEWAQADFGLLAAGGVVTTVYTSSSTQQVEYLLGDAGATGVVVQDGELLERVLDVEDALELSFIVLLDETDHAAVQREDVYTLDAVHSLGAERFDEETYQARIDERSPEDLASLIYTSGTTGKPKGVELTHWNFKSNVDQVRKRYGPRPDKDEEPIIGPDSTTVSFLPLAHVFERLSGHFHMFSAGATVAYAESPDTLQEDYAAGAPTVGTSVPRVYEKIYAAIREQASESALKERIFNWAIEVGREYAMAEEPGAWLSVQQSVADRLEVRHDERAHELLLVADDHHLFDDLDLGERVLDRRRGHVLAGREHQQLLGPLQERDVSLLVLRHDVARAEPRAAIVLRRRRPVHDSNGSLRQLIDERPLGRLGLVPVASGHVRPANEQLADRARLLGEVRLPHDRGIETRLQVVQWRPDRADLRGLEGVDRRHRRGLGQAVAFQHRDPHAVIELDEVLREAPAARQH